MAEFMTFRTKQVLFLQDNLLIYLYVLVRGDIVAVSGFTVPYIKLSNIKK
jgi:hypothetical protein